MNEYQTVIVRLDELHEHPRNYQKHPEDQIAHLVESIEEHGIYRNVVIARDNTILAGHGVVEAAGRLGMEAIPAVRLDLDSMDPRALKLLVADNEISHLAEVNDRALTEILKEVQDLDPAGLLGTGYDEMMLANLVMVTRPASEVEDFDAAAHWVGLPEYENPEKRWTLKLYFDTGEERDAMIDRLGVNAVNKNKPTASAWYPPRKKEDVQSVRFESEDDDGD